MHLVLDKLCPFVFILLESSKTRIEDIPEHHIESLKEVMQPLYFALVQT